MIEDEDILIENYLKGLLAEDEQQSFLERLESDITFKEKFKLEEQLFNTLNEDSWSFAEIGTTEVKDYKTALEQSDLQNLKRTLIHVNKELNSKEDKTIKKILYYLVAAAVVIFLGFQFFFDQRTSNEDLYYNYINLNNLPSFVTRGQPSENDLIEAQELFEAKSYGKSLSIFERILENNKTDASIYIYVGIAQTELGLYENAENTFNGLISSNLFDAQIGYWYKGLLFLKSDRKEEAIDVLSKIVKENLFNKSKAEELLKELE